MKLSNLQKELLNLLQIWAVAMIIAWGVDPEFKLETRGVATILAVFCWIWSVIMRHW